MNNKELKKTIMEFAETVEKAKYQGKRTMLLLVTDGSTMDCVMDGYSKQISEAMVDAMLEDKAIAQGICSATARYYKLKKQMNNGTENK